MQRWRVASREEREAIVSEVGSDEAVAMMKAQQEKERQVAMMLEAQAVEDSAMDMTELEPEVHVKSQTLDPKPEAMSPKSYVFSHPSLSLADPTCFPSVTFVG